MIDLINVWAQGWAQYFGLALVQNTLFLAFILLILKLMKNAPARVKYSISLIGLAKLLLPPLLPAPFLAPQTILSQPAGTGSLVYLETATTSGGPVSSSPVIAASTPLSLLGLFLLIWTGIALIALIVPFLSTLRLKWLLRNAQVVQSDHIKSILPHRDCKILKTDKIQMPLTLGVFPRQIFVPALWDQWTDPCRKMILRHEMAHIHRRDGLVQIFQIIIQAVYFFHPLVWILNRKVNELREMACDDESIGFQKNSSVEYSRYLVEIAEKLVHDQLGCSSASALIRQKNELLKRVMYQTQEDKMRTLSKRKTGVVMAMLLLLTVSLSWTRGRPKAPPDEIISNQEETFENQDKNFTNQFFPLPKGGLEAIQNNVVYPDAALKAGLEGRVVLHFTVDKSGPYGKIGIKETTFEDDMGCHQAAIDAVQKTEWIKSSLSDKDKMGGWFEIPIEFRLGDEDTQKIKGTIKDKETGKPVSDVFVNIPNTDFKVRSDKNGNFELLFVPVGELAIQAEFDGYKTLYLSPVILKLGKDLHLNIELAPTTISVDMTEQDAPSQLKKGLPVHLSDGKTGLVTGKVVDEKSGDPLPGTNVFLEGETMASGAAAGSDGKYLIKSVKPGSYEMKISMMGYKSIKIADVIVKKDKTTKFDVKLSPVLVKRGESKQDHQVINLYFKDNDTPFVDGKKISFKKLEDVLTKKATGNMENVFINIQAEDDVGMLTILNTQKVLRDLGLKRVNYTINEEKGMPYMLPPKGTEQEIKKISERNVVNLMMNKSGEVLYDGEQIDIPDIKTRIKSEPAMHENILIVGIEPHPETRYKDFADVLNQVKGSGANRVFIHLASPPPPPPPK
jgi:TonB family protein